MELGRIKNPCLPGVRAQTQIKAGLLTPWSEPIVAQNRDQII